jgi:hypothetical protein
MRLLVRGFVSCVLATGARGQWYPSSSNVTVLYPPPAQTVVILHESPLRPAESQEQSAPVRQITYFIAFKDNIVRVADQYWVDGNTLHYVTTDHQRMTAPVNTVDRILSKRLNSEQNVAFYLPPESKRAVAQTRPVRHTASLRKRCDCSPDRSARVSSRTGGGASRSAPGEPMSK